MGSFLEMKKITKMFNDNMVLNNIDFIAEKGKVNALIGENGAGKSTLMKILAGVYQPDLGEIFIDGKHVSIKSVNHAMELGIAMVYQEIRLFPELTIMENIFMRREPMKNIRRLKIIDWEKAFSETCKYLGDFNLDLNPKTLVKKLSMGQQKFVQIIKALVQNAAIIVMDEPTSMLAKYEVDLLFDIICRLKDKGAAIIYISHRIEEIEKIADNVTVLRDGELVEKLNVEEINVDRIVKAMAGKDMADRYPKLKVKIGKERLKVENLCYEGRLKNISFNVKKGEIFGIMGLSGSGRRTLAKVLCGVFGPYEGNIYINGIKFKSMTPHLAKMNGLCYVTRDVAEEGLLNDIDIVKNITIANLERVSKMGVIDKSAEIKSARDLMEQLEIKAEEGEPVANLSGGKQKKIIFAKWLFANAKIMIVDEPTAGIDINSKVDIYNIINELVLSGTSVIIISSDLSEILGLCDRCAVMFNGEIRGVFRREELSQEKLLYFATGSHRAEAGEESTAQSQQ